MNGQGLLTPPEPEQRLVIGSTDGVRLAAEVHGPAGAPLVVLSHGWTCSVRMWAPVIRALRGEFRVVAYDQRGHGRSSVPGPAGYRVGALAEDLAAVLDEVAQRGRIAVLAGHSMGGMAIMAAAARPGVLDRVSSVLLASTGCDRLVTGSRLLPVAGAPDWVSGGGQRIAAPVLREAMRSALPLGLISPVSSVALRFAVLGPHPPAGVAALTAQIVHGCDRKARAGWGRVLTTLDLADCVVRLDRPASVVVGSADRLTPPAQAKRLASLLPNPVGYTVVVGAGHMTPLEAPGTLADAIRELAARQDARRSDARS